MISRELIKAKIDKVKETDLELLYKIVEAIISTDKPATEPAPDRKPESDSASRTHLVPELQQRQAELVGHARQLQIRLGDPIDALAEFLSDLPPDNDEFWQQVLEGVD